LHKESTLTTQVRTRGGEDGFTLIELMVVVLIIAILISISIPTFLGAQNRARDRGAQSDLRNALTAVKTIATDHSGFFISDAGTPLTASDIPTAEPAIDFSDTVATTSVVLIATTAGGDDVTMVKQSASSRFFGITSDNDGRVRFCRGSTQAECDEPTDAAYTGAW
jgi:type IV pilus assembly protein PilA